LCLDCFKGKGQLKVVAMAARFAAGQYKAGERVKRLEAGAEASVNLSIAFDRCYQSLLFSSTSCLPTKSKHKVGNRAKMQTQQPQTPHQQQQNPQPSFAYSTTESLFQ